MLNSWLIVIPARLASTRLPEKPLADLCGKPLVVRVAENLKTLMDLGAVIVVATDSSKIAQVCQASGIESIMTAESHASGTDRCHEVSQKFKKKYIMNVQGDEPFADVESLQKLMTVFETSSFDMGTLAYRRTDFEDFSNPNIVKVVFNHKKKALYFSRSPIPFARDQKIESWWQHQGVYVYTYETLDQFVKFKVSSLENCEKLEQLRALENGLDILVVESKRQSVGIDTPEDLAKARLIMKDITKGNG